MKRTEHNIIVASDSKGNIHIFTDSNRVTAEMSVIDCISFIGEHNLFTEITKTVLKYYMQ